MAARLGGLLRKEGTYSRRCKHPDSRQLLNGVFLLSKHNFRRTDNSYLLWACFYCVHSG
jgi:hypothetical protein